MIDRALDALYPYPYQFLALVAILACLAGLLVAPMAAVVVLVLAAALSFAQAWRGSGGR